MNLVPMSFRSYVWPCNPETVKVEYARNTARFRAPGGTDAVQENGAAPRKAAGHGHFTGSGCLEEFRRLSEVFSAGGSGTLSIPGTEPFPAVFASLVMKGEPRPDCVEYEFEFLENASAAEPGEAGVYVCTGGESLWDVAARFGTDVDTLRAANRQIEWPDALETGERVTLA